MQSSPISLTNSSSTFVHCFLCISSFLILYQVHEIGRWRFSWLINKQAILIFMDWNFNFSPNSECLSEFDQDSISNVTPIDDSINFGSSGTRKRGEFMFDLKLGPVCNNSIPKSGNEDGESTMNKWKEAPDGANSGSSSSNSRSSTKRTRSSNDKNQTVYCLVDGCNSDLSSCREYHRRHKVCETHSKTAVVMIRGQKQRFCQQCSRFHALEEFDEGKRSCRKRLDGHNRRRRKLQPDSAHRAPSLLSHFQGVLNFLGTKMLEFSSSHAFPTTTVVSPTWSVVAATNGTISYGGQQQFNPRLPVSSSTSYRTEKHQFPFLQDESRHGAAARTRASYSNGRDSDCALSLLSSSSSSFPTQPHDHRNHHVLPFGSNPIVEPVSVTVNSADEMAVYGSGLFQNATGAVSDGSVNETASQTFPYHWE